MHSRKDWLIRLDAPNRATMEREFVLQIARSILVGDCSRSAENATRNVGLRSGPGWRERREFF